MKDHTLTLVKELEPSICVFCEDNGKGHQIDDEKMIVDLCQMIGNDKFDAKEIKCINIIICDKHYEKLKKIDEKTDSISIGSDFEQH